MASIAALIEAFANARLARDEHLKAQARLAAARRTGMASALTEALASETACLKVRADHLTAQAEKLLPRGRRPAMTGSTAATLMQ